MKEITRIHIAKVPYDIEIVAKKELEKYLHALEAYGSDSEVIGDIEIRITELLEERGVKKSGVIGQVDVTAIKEQLGEPSEIMGDGDIAIGESIATNGSKKLFRDTDNPVLGGVLSGIAYFFGINPLWVRLLFIILALASFGTAFLVYIVLWIAVPPAKTAADKLQMRGRPVTVNSIREFNENEATRPLREGGTSGQRVVTALAGTLAVFGAVGAALVTIAATIGVLTKGRDELAYVNGDASGLFIAAFILMVISGVLLTALFTLGAFAAFAQKMTKRVAITMGIVVVLGISTFATAVGLAQYGTSRHQAAVDSLMKETNVALPMNAQSIGALALDTKDVKVTYKVTDGAPSATLRAISGTSGKLSTSLDGQTLRVAASNFQADDCKTTPWCLGTQPELVINGPRLADVQLSDKDEMEYIVSNQEKLTVKTGALSHFVIPSGTIDALTVAAGENSMVRVERASIASIVADMTHESELSAGVIEHFTLKSPTACPEGGSKAIVDIERITSGTMTINDTVLRSATENSACANVIIDNEDER